MTRLAILLVLAMLLGPRALAQPEAVPTPEAETDFEHVVRALSARWQEVDAYTADMTVTMDVRKMGLRVKSDMAGSVVYQRNGDDPPRMRSELAGSTEAGPFGIINMPMQTLTVSDGTYTWSEQRAKGEVKVTKTKAARRDDDQGPGGGAERLEAFREKYDLRVLPERSLGGRAAYVLEGRPREELEENGIQADRALFYFDQQTGILVIMALLDRKSRPLLEVKFNDIRLNPDLPEGAFAYTVPPGAEVTDKTEPDRPAG